MYEKLFEPIRIGSMELRNRVMMPPHAAAIGNLFGTDEEAAANIEYLAQRARAGVAWVGAVSALMRNNVPPGFDPTGVGATRDGYLRLPTTPERFALLARAVHAEGAVLTVQLVNQGGMPHAPSSTLSGPIVNQIPHAMREDEIAWFVKEYAESAAIVKEAGADGVELHLNHDDLFEWFLSPRTNRREDRYGGSMEGRATFAVEVLEAIRHEVGPQFTVGVRINLRQEEPGGFTDEDAVKIAAYLEQQGLVDYVHGVVGSPWGSPSYIQPAYFAPGEWAPLSGAMKAALTVPVVYSGRVLSPDVAEQVLRDGQADVVGVARAHIADGEFVLKAAEGRAEEIRPCVGGNECISRKHVEGLPFGCAVNPSVLDTVRLAVRRPTRLVVVGGGPAGMEAAALAAESGMDVTLFEAADRLGGQLNVFSHAPGQGDFEKYVHWQEVRLRRNGVDVRVATTPGLDDVLACNPDSVVVATGSRPRVPDFAGASGEGVADNRSALTSFHQGARSRVLVVAQDDHLPPLTTADHLAGLGHDVTLVYSTPAPAMLVGRYVIGAVLARLDRQGVTVVTCQDVTDVSGGNVAVRHSFSGRASVLGEFEYVVLACGSVPEPGPYADLVATGLDTHLIGDAFAPRRLVFATRQAHAVVRQLVERSA
jgi:2,4-dienoyl-CoA reductase-like NADH-dependent reductase (Old Yellow Enzyme family)/thioredoxin reductase